MGSDPNLLTLAEVSSRFNSRSRMGSDAAEAAPTPEQLVSIHAPAWGATYHSLLQF